MCSLACPRACKSIDARADEAGRGKVGGGNALLRYWTYELAFFSFVRRSMR